MWGTKLPCTEVTLHKIKGHKSYAKWKSWLECKWLQQHHTKNKKNTSNIPRITTDLHVADWERDSTEPYVLMPYDRVIVIILLKNRVEQNGTGLQRHSGQVEIRSN